MVKQYPSYNCKHQFTLLIRNAYSGNIQNIITMDDLFKQ